MVRAHAALADALNGRCLRRVESVTESGYVGGSTSQKARTRIGGMKCLSAAHPLILRAAIDVLEGKANEGSHERCKERGGCG